MNQSIKPQHKSPKLSSQRIIKRYYKTVGIGALPSAQFSLPPWKDECIMYRNIFIWIRIISFLYHFDPIKSQSIRMHFLKEKKINSMVFGVQNCTFDNTEYIKSTDKSYICLNC